MLFTIEHTFLVVVLRSLELAILSVNLIFHSPVMFIVRIVSYFLAAFSEVE